MALAGQAHSSSRVRCLCGAPDLRAVDLWPALRGVLGDIRFRPGQPSPGRARVQPEQDRASGLGYRTDHGLVPE